MPKCKFMISKFHYDLLLYHTNNDVSTKKSANKKLFYLFLFLNASFFKKAAKIFFRFLKKGIDKKKLLWYNTTVLLQVVQFALPDYFTKGGFYDSMIVIDKFSRKPIYEQIIEGIERQIVSGLLKELDQLPSIRELSVTLSINPNTIQKAFTELDRAGIIFSTQGRGCFVSENAKEKIRNRTADKLEAFSALAHELSLSGIEEGTLMEIVKKACTEK